MEKGRLREQSVQDALASQQRVVTDQLLSNGTRRTNGPHVHHGELGLFSVELDLENLVLKSVATLGSDVSDGTARARRECDQVVGDQTVLIDSTIGVATSDVIADLNRRMSKILVVSAWCPLVTVIVHGVTLKFWGTKSQEIFLSKATVEIPRGM